MNVVVIDSGAPPERPLAQRDATADDLELTCAITKDAMRDYVEQTWGAWDDVEQDRMHRETFTPATHRIITAGGEVAGLVATENRPGHLWLAKLYLLRAFRGQGIGTAVLRDIVRRADAQGKPVRLRVLRVNVRAQALYARHGFRVVDETPERIFMERTPGSAIAPSS